MYNDINSLQAAVQSLEAQLVSLYEEKQTIGSPAMMKETIKNLEQQLCDLYAEKQTWSINPAHAQSAIENMEQQIIAHCDEKVELMDELSRFKRDHEELKLRAKALGAAVFEASLFGDEFKK